FLISYPFFRLKGGYFAIGTLSMILLLHTFFTNFYQYTGGTAGIILPYPTSPLAFPLMISSLLLLLLAIYVHLSIRQSRFLLVMGFSLPPGIVNASFLKRYSAARPDELILRRLRRTPPRNSLAPRSRSRSSGLPQ